ncbi:hypothetical protein [Campylobacter sputorum]|uniref:hypothetical protein n=1 Tax=Campylobacter sputorum TaxID=206 RepID=UPI00069163E2|nr:hypothetical protein [Campylobacter sputorum]
MGDLFSSLLDKLEDFVMIGMFIALIVIAFIDNAIKKREEQLSLRQEQVDIFGDGVANGITKILEDQRLMQAVAQNGIKVEYKIDIDGNKNIIITGNNNSILK